MNSKLHRKTVAMLPKQKLRSPKRTASYRACSTVTRSGSGHAEKRSRRPPLAGWLDRDNRECLRACPSPATAAITASPIAMKRALGPSMPAL